MSRIGEVASNSMVPVRFSSANRRMVIMGMKNSPMTLTFESSGRMTISFTIHREALAAHLRFHAHQDEITKRVPEEEAEDQREHGQQQIRDRRNEIAVQFFAANDPDISHLLFPLTADCLRGSSSLQRRFVTGELQEDLFQAHGGGAKFVEVPAGFDHGARQIAADEAVFPAFDFEDCAVLRALLEHHAADAGNLFEPLLDGCGIQARHCGRRLRAAPIRRRARGSAGCCTESVATSLPLLMMSTCSQVCSTSGRMWVLRMMVWSPARLLIRSRVSLICLGSRPAVGSSRISTSGL